MKLKVLLLLWIVMLQPVCGDALPITLVTEKSDVEDITEAVFRYQVQQQSSRGRKVFYLAIGLEHPSAPSDDFMGRFKDLSYVRKFIEKEYDAAQIRKEKGLVLGVGEVKRPSEGEAEAEGYHFVIPGEAEGFQFQVARENGKWVVKSTKATWIASRRWRTSACS